MIIFISSRIDLYPALRYVCTGLSKFNYFSQLLIELTIFFCRAAVASYLTPAQSAAIPNKHSAQQPCFLLVVHKHRVQYR